MLAFFFLLDVYFQETSLFQFGSGLWILFFFISGQQRSSQLKFVRKACCIYPNRWQNSCSHLDMS